jgi:parallel beta-helix repeat protein
MALRVRMALLGLVASLAVAGYGQGIVYVNGATGDDAWDGRCAVWDGGTCGPKATIQAGINVALTGEQVLIADGTYRGVGNRDLDFVGKAVTVCSASDNPVACVIDCENAGRGFYFHTAEGAASALRGLTIRNGNGTDYGGAVYCSGSSPTLIGCIFVGNTSTAYGGAVACRASSAAILTDCTIANNTAPYGGGVYCRSSSATLVNCTIEANLATSTGGGVNCYTASPTLTNCVISGNIARSSQGGAIWCNGSGIRLTNCTIVGNTAASGGGALDCRYSPAPSLTNCILWGDAPLEISTYSSTPSITYCDVQGGWTGAGNINSDPGFAFAGDLHVLPGSACIDAGTNSPSGGLPAADLDGQPRPLDGNGDGQAVADMGAYELNPAAPAIALSATEFTFVVPQGQSSAQALSVRNSSLGTLNWELGWEAEWLSADPTSGQSTGESDAVTLTVAPQALLHGVYETVLWVTDPQAINSPRAVSIVLFVPGSLFVPDEYPTIQAGIDAANPGDQVEVADGVYTGAGNKNLDFRGKTITVRSASDNPAGCIIDCEYAGRGFYFHSAETAEAIVTGFAIRHGGSSAVSGGGVYSVSGASPTITNCIITGCIASNGAGLYLSSGSATVMNCTITDCIAGRAGGAWCSGATLVNCTIAGCASRDSGGGAYCSGGATLASCRISGNQGADGAGVHCEGAADLANCLITGNTASHAGGGVYCSSSDATITNCTIYDNVSNSGGALYCAASSTPSLTNCILWADIPDEIYVESGGPDVTYCDVQGGWTGTANISAEPGYAFAADYHLLPTSACVDAGSNSPPGGLVSADLEGQPRPVDGNGDGAAIADMGAYELQPALPAIALSSTALTFFVPRGQCASQTVGIRNSSLGTLNWELSWQADWLSADVTVGQSSGEVDFVTLTVDTQALVHGRYDDVVQVTDPQACNSPRTVSLELYVNASLFVPAEYATIQAAIDAAVDGDEVVIADGVYTGAGNKDLDFHGKLIAVHSASGDPGACVIDCEQYGRGFYFHSHESAAAAVHGITIRNGRVLGSAGGGVYCDYSSPTLSHCRITDNEAFSGGGGVYCSDSSPMLLDCTIAGNSAQESAGDAHGGGLECVGGSPTLVNCTLTGNTITAGGSPDHIGRGGAMYCSDGAPRLINCTIAGNTASHYGGGVYCTESASATLRDSMIIGNTVGFFGFAYPVRGGGVYCGGAALIGCTLAGNTSWDYYGGALCCSGNPTLTDCILWGNSGDGIYVSSGSPSLTYSDVQGGFAGTGNINADPLFADPDGADGDPATWQDNDYHLTAASPCVDYGDPAFLPLPDEVDLDGNPRVWDGNGDGVARVDMGAYEFQPIGYERGDLNCDGARNAFDIDPFVLALTDPVGYAAAFPACDRMLADVNCDGNVNAFDIDPFVGCLTGGGCAPCP